MCFLLTGRWAFYWGLIAGGGAYNRGGLITGKLITEGAYNWGRL